MHKILVTGHNGMVGSAIHQLLQQKQSCPANYSLHTVSRRELDLRNQNQVANYFEEHQFNEVYLAAAKVGGIAANNEYRADFIYDNLQIQNNVINSCYNTKVGKLLFLGSSCIYPKNSIQPIEEHELLTGPLEHTNEPYAIAKIAGLKMCEAYKDQYQCDFRAVMPTNLYGPGDNFHPENSHVIPGLMYRFREAINENRSNVVIWGSGKPRREFLHVKDMAEACLYVMSLEQCDYESLLGETPSHVNIGTGEDCSIQDLSNLLKNVSGYKGKIVFDTSKPDGTPRKLLSVKKLREFGWENRTSLEVGLKSTWDWYLSIDSL